VKKIFTASIVTLLGLGMILTSWDSYRRGPIASISSNTHVFARDAKGVKVFAKQYTRSESKAFLDRNLIGYGYQPIQVTVENNTAESYVLSRDGISLPSASGKKVAMSISKKAFPRSIALKIASFFFMPMMIPSTLDGIYTLKNHMQMRKDYSAKGVKDEDEKIAPYSTFHRVVFVPNKEMRETLTVTLLAEDDKKDAISFINTLEKAADDAVQLDKVE
jgi:hypothetical protein